jgi:hypothetical protein
MMFRRLRSSPPKVIGFRVAVFALGLAYLLATTDTIHTIGMALAGIKNLVLVFQQVPTTPH